MKAAALRIVRGSAPGQPYETGTMPDTRHPGPVIMKRRKDRGMLLADLAKRSGVSTSTISRIENGKISPSYSVLMRIGEALEIQWSTVFNDHSTSFAPGCRAISRANSEIKQTTSRGLFEWLATDLTTKRMEPILVHVQPDAEHKPLEGHPGTEEFIYVLVGAVTFYMQHYAPVALEMGDSVYFDSSIPHAVAGRNGPAQFLSISCRGV